MAVKTTAQLRDWLTLRMRTLFGTSYHVYDSRIRGLGADKFPAVRVGVTSGSEDEDGFEDLTVTVMVAHQASMAAADPDKAVVDLVDADLLKVRNSLRQTDIHSNIGALTRMSWDYGQSDESNELAAWVVVSVTFRRFALYTDDNADPLDFDTAYIETTISEADVTVETEVSL